MARVTVFALLTVLAAAPSLGADDFELPWGLPYAEAARKYGLTSWAKPAELVLALPAKQLGPVSVTRQLYFTGGRLSHAGFSLACTQWPRKKLDVDCGEALKLFAKTFASTAMVDGGCVNKFEIGTAEVRLADVASGAVFVMPIWRPSLPLYDKRPATGCF